MCELYGQSPVTARRIADYISDLNMLDILVAKEVSRGRYGRTRIINLKLSLELLEKILNYSFGQEE